MGVERPTTVPKVLAAVVADHGDRLAVADGDVSHTWAELADRARRFAAALVETGVQPGDRVAIWAPNGYRWIVAVLGLFEAGAVLVPINTRYKGVEAADILERSRCTVLVTTRTFLGTDYVAMLDDAGRELPDLTTTVIAEGDDWDAFMARATPAALEEVARRAAALTPDSPSDLLFTSGTTGKPKGVVQTHGRSTHVALDWVEMTELNENDRYLMVNPYFHMFGLKAGILSCVGSGTAMYPEPVFDVDRALAAVEREQITVLPGAPTIYHSVLDHPDRADHDLSSLRVAVTGAAEIPTELIRRIRDELPFEIIVAGYGMTETGTITATAPHDDPEVTANTVGRPRPGVEMRLMDGDREVDPGEPGEVVVRGPSVMLGYLDDPESTAEALSDDGWLRSGDLGRLRDDGNLQIVGRLKDMFIVGGFNAYPAEIENLLLGHPDVLQAAVIGIPDERMGEVGMAFVTTRSDDPDLPEQVIAWSRDQMANYKVPRRVMVVDELPTNATGKVVKDDLRKLAGG